MGNDSLDGSVFFKVGLCISQQIICKIFEGDDTNADISTTECVDVYLMQPFVNAGRILYMGKF